MKKLILLTAFVIVTTLSFSQIQVVARGGFNLAKFIGSDAEAWGDLGDKPKITVRFHAGFAANVWTKGSITIQPGIRYSYKGTKYEGTEMVYNDETFEEVSRTSSNNKKLHYIDVPILVRYKINENIDVFAGPQVSILVSAKNDADTQYEQGKIDVKEFYNTIDFGLAFGSAYYWPSGLHVQVEVDLGLTSVTSETIYSGNGMEEKASVKNLVFQFSVGYPIFN